MTITPVLCCVHHKPIAPKLKHLTQSPKPPPFLRSAAAYALAAGLASLVGAAVGLVLLGLVVLGGLGLVATIPVMQGWGGLTWQSWGELSAGFSFEAWERETLQGCALARCMLRCA